MEIPAEYRGREQAYIKHTLLETYLFKLLMIIGQSLPTVSYVDCLAGPWQEAAEDLSDTSIGRSLATMRKCLESLQKVNPNVRFRALFVEKDAKKYRRLKEYLDNLSTPVETESFHGEFDKVRHKILDWCGSSFTFFFVDPLGWKHIVDIPTLEPFLKRPNSEFLINFMFEFILRAHKILLHEDDMINLFGQVPQTDGMTPEQKEACLVKLYRENLKSVLPPLPGRKPRSVTVPIQRPDKDRTIYHLVYLTRHPLGIVKFMDASEPLDFVQKAVRIQAKHDKKIETTGQGELFGAFESVKAEQGTVPISVVKEDWLRQLTSEPQQFGIERLADMLEETGWFESNFQEAFHELQLEGKVINLDVENSRRKKKFVHFDENRSCGERLAKVTT